MDQLVTGDGSTTALRGGEGDDLLIIHSLLTDREAFRSVVPSLMQRFRVTLINLPGFHGSRPIEGTLEAYVGWLSKAREQLGIGENYILCGNGFGGTIALAFALNHPRGIRKLLLVDVAAAFPEGGKNAFRAMADKVAHEGMKAIVSVAAKRVYHDEYVLRHPEVVEERRKVLCDVEPSAFMAACELLIRCDLVPGLPSLRVPTMVVYGDRDQATPAALNRTIAAGVPDCLVAEIPECGHCPPLENPVAFLRAIEAFL
jgi:3-oxoadipate enol-lactonase